MFTFEPLHNLHFGTSKLFKSWFLSFFRLKAVHGLNLVGFLEEVERLQFLKGVYCKRVVRYLRGLQSSF